MTEKFTCPRRIENGMHLDKGPFRGSGANQDSFQKGHGLVGQREGCSYCGSMSGEEFLVAIASGAAIEPTDKPYKFYVKGYAAKFYTQHLSEEQGFAFDALWKEDKINWGYAGPPYVPLYIPGPSTRQDTETTQAY